MLIKTAIPSILRMFASLKPRPSRAAFSVSNCASLLVVETGAVFALATTALVVARAAETTGASTAADAVENCENGFAVKSPADDSAFCAEGVNSSPIAGERVLVLALLCVEG